MTKIRALITLHANGKQVDIGQEVDLKQEEAESLVDRGFAELAEGKPNQPSAELDPSIEDIIDAILQLDPKKDYGKDGIPNIKPIEKILGVTITSAQRDNAWEQLEKDTSEKKS